MADDKYITMVVETENGKLGIRGEIVYLITNTKCLCLFVFATVLGT